MALTRSQGGPPAENHQSEMEVDEVTTKNSSEIATGQKRPRDFGEELKGLTPDRESNAPDSPSAKRVRRSSEEGENGHPPSDSLDDGEIVETSAPSQHLPLSDSATSEQTGLQPSVPASQPDPESHADPVPDQIVSQDEPAVPEQALSPDFVSGEEHQSTVDPNPSPDEPGQTASTPSPVETKQNAETSDNSAGWNQGVGLGLRTSFGKAPDKQPKANVPTSSPGIVSFPMMNKDWRIDASKFEQVTCDFELDHAERSKPQFWRRWMMENLEHLIIVLQEHNDFSLDSLKKPTQKVKMIRNALVALLHPAGGVLHGTKKDKALARGVAQPVFDELNIKAVNKRLKKLSTPQGIADQTNEAGSEGNEEPQEDEKYKLQQESASVDDIEAGEVQAEDQSPPTPEELEHRKLYFPGSENYPIFCIHCVSTRHISGNCPQLACQFCSSREHTRYGCPRKQRCSKCRQVGHTKDTCQEKLSLTTEEMEPCAYCGSAHTEDQCIQVWKSFNPAEVEIKKVKTIPAFCYTCGQEGHYGPECGLAVQGDEAESGLSIWSAALRDFYIDPNSANVAIAWVGLDTNKITPGQNMSIRGLSKKQTHVYYVSSDGESDDGFIHDPVQKPPQRGNIQINTSSSRPAPRRGGFSSLRRPESQRRQDQREFSPPPPPPQELFQAHGDWQPPLPAGPPPPLPGAYTFQGNTLPHAPPGTLPPRPGPQGFRNANGSSQNGSKRGRGRARKHR
ncbi:hypothetical protein AB5N19_09219 [Seiridium cardinale]